MLDGEKLRELRREYLDVDDPEEKRKRIASILEKMEISSMNFIYKLERGDSNARIDTIFRLAEALECEPWELISQELFNSLMPDKVWDRIIFANLRKYISEEDKEKIPDRYKKLLDNQDLVKDLKGEIKKIPVTRTAGESEKGSPKPYKGFPKKEYIELPYSDCEALEVVNDSLEPFYREGDILIVNHEYRNWKSGDLCEVMLFEERFIRIVHHNEDGNYYTIQSLNPKYKTLMVTADQVDWIYKVVAVVKE